MKNGIIYCIKNLINNKCYIGQTICSLHKRKIEHLNCAKNKKIKNYCLIHKALNKYGAENFVFSIIWEGNYELLNEKEIEFITIYDSYNNGYNLTKGGSGKLGIKPENHPSYDINIYTFYHTSGKTENLTKFNFRKKYNIHHSCIYYIFNSPNLSAKGWSLNPIKIKLYNFINIYTNKNEINISFKDMYKKYNLDRSGLNKVIKNKRPHFKGWKII